MRLSPRMLWRLGLIALFSSADGSSRAQTITFVRKQSGNTGSTTTPRIPDGYHPCKKQTVGAVITLESGEVFRGSNWCRTEKEVCPRVVAGCHSGDAYELCGPPIHAEIDALSQMPPGQVDGTVRVTGHDFFCKDCQLALGSKGITHFIIDRSEDS